jgi:hypothetical protein
VGWEKPNGVEDAVKMVKFAQQPQQQKLLGEIGIKFTGLPHEPSDNSW